MPVAYQRRLKINFNQNKKLMAINNNKESGQRGAKRSEEERRGAKRSEEEQRGAKVPDSTINDGKCYSLVHTGDWIFKTT